MKAERKVQSLPLRKGGADKALELVDETDSLVFFIEVKEADLVLAKTPDMLPMLKTGRCGGSGGRGLVQM